MILKISGKFNLVMLKKIKIRLMRGEKLNLWYYEQTKTSGVNIVVPLKEITIDSPFNCTYDNTLIVKRKNDNKEITLKMNKIFVFENYEEAKEHYNKMLFVNISLINSDINFMLEESKNEIIKMYYSSKIHILTNVRNQLMEWFIDTDYIMESLANDVF